MDGSLKARVPEALASTVAEYRRLYDGYEPANARYLTLHKGHFIRPRPEEERFLTAALVRDLTTTGTAEELVERVRRSRRRGLPAAHDLPRPGPRGRSRGVGARPGTRLTAIDCQAVDGLPLSEAGVPPVSSPRADSAPGGAEHSRRDTLLRWSLPAPQSGHGVHVGGFDHPQKIRSRRRRSTPPAAARRESRAGA